MTNINLDFKDGQTLVVLDYNTSSVNVYNIKDEDYTDCKLSDDSESFDMYKLLRELGHNEDECSYMWAYQDLQITLP